MGCTTQQARSFLCQIISSRCSTEKPAPQTLSRDPAQAAFIGRTAVFGASVLETEDRLQIGHSKRLSVLFIIIHMNNTFETAIESTWCAEVSCCLSLLDGKY